MWYNRIMIGLLSSPLHIFVSKNMLLVNYTGRKSGQAYRVPVNYLPDGELLYTTSQLSRVWWRNLRDGQPVTLRLRGQNVQAVPQVVEEPQAVKRHFKRYFELQPRLARYFDVGLEHGQPKDEDLRRCAQGRVMVVFEVQGNMG
ncbi:MAG: nitroreductase family deazaflavin-dependent oxidoreductase [Anaerolineales bacterium]|nr:nitroreductase family deazaflavin-dependent oxidoreductase [Anaerolineales bacterium]